MSIGTVHPLLQIWQPRPDGSKLSQNLQIHYYSGQSNPPEYMIALSNHRFCPDSLPTRRIPRRTGRISFSTEEEYWQGSRIQAMEFANDNPLVLDMDSDVDVAFADLHGFTVEPIPAGASRFLLIRCNGTGLTFTDLMLIFTLTHPASL